jgi:hypothetical protein
MAQTGTGKKKKKNPLMVAVLWDVAPRSVVDTD